MSTTVESRVVEMRFDNGQFERNVSNTMSTLDKLKAKLNFSGSAKGLNDVNAAAKNVDMNGLARGVEAVSARFSALQVMGVTALANITNSAVNAGKRIASALTIDPIKTGLSEYETKMNAIQVIQANTRGKNTMDEITAALDELNEYADKTIYNFTQMTSNVGKFTAQGFDVKEATNAMKGLANLAAASGASAEDMSRATYQMSQALGSTIKLMDWNSLRNANMATQDLKNTLIDLAKVNGIAIDDMIAKHGSFEQTLSEGWLTGKMFTEAMNIYSGLYSDAELRAKGFNESQIKNFKELAAMAESAATEVKTFTQLWDVLKETAQSGWTQTWELLVGDFESAKKMWTNLQVYFSDIINGWSDARNVLLGGVLKPSETWSKISEKLSLAGLIDASGLGKFKEVAETVTDVTDKLEYFQNVVNKVWRGDYGNSDTGRFELLEKEGYDHRVVQDLVNKGYEYKLTVEDIEASHKKFGLTMEESAASTKKNTTAIAELSDEKLRDAGLTEAEIRLYRDLEAEAKRTGKTIGEVVDEMSKADGRTMIIETFKNAWNGLVTILGAVKDAWVSIFPPISVVRLYSIVKIINEFSERLKVSDDTAKKIQRTFRGLFAIIDIIATVTGGALKIAFKVVTELLSRFDLNILDVTAAVGDAIVKFRDWIDSIINVSDIVDVLVPLVKAAAKYVRQFLDAVKGSKEFSSFVNRIKGMTTAIRDWLKSFKDSDNIPRDIIAGLAKGIREGAPEVIAAVFDLAKSIITGICEVLGIHSPSTAMIAIGGFIVAGLILGLQNGIDGIWPAIKDIGAKIIEWFNSLDLGTIIGIGLSVALFSTFKTIADAMNVLAAPFEGFGEMCEKIGGAFDGLKASLKASAWEKRARAVLTFALAIGVLAASAYVLSSVDPGKLWNAIGAIAALALVIGILSVTIGKIGSTDGLEVGKFSIALLGISASLLLVAFALKQLSGIDPDAMSNGILGLSYVVMSMVGLIAATNLMGKNVDKIGSTLIKMTIAMGLLIFVAKLAASLDPETMSRGGTAILAFSGIFAGLMLITKLFGKNADKVGGTLIKMSIAMMILIGVIKLASMLDPKTAGKGGLAILAFSGIFAGLMLITKLFGKDANKLGSTLLAMSSAMFVMALVVKLLAGMSTADITKGVLAVAAFGAIITGLVAATRLAGENELKRVSSTILMMSISIGVLALVATLLGMLSVEHLAKGITAVTILGGVMAGLVWATRGANDCKGNLIVMTVAIGLLVASVAALSLIDTDKLITASASLSLVLGMFALLVKSSGAAKGSLGSLIVMTGAVSLIAGVLYLLSSLPAKSSLSAAAALSTVLLAVSGALVIVSKAGPIASGALIAMGVMTLVAGGLAGILYLLSGLPVQNALGAAASLSLLLLAMSGALMIVSAAGPIASSALIAIGVMTLIVGGLAVILYLLSGLPVSSTIITAFALSELLLVMAGVCAVVSYIPAAAAINGALGLAAFVGIMAGVLAALGGLSKIPGFNELIADGGKSLSLIGYAIGDFVGSIIGGFAAGATSGLPEVGKNLSDFMTNATPFIEGVKNLDMSVLTGVGALAGAIMALTAADLLAGIATFLTGGSSFAQLGTDLSQFMINAMPFIAGAAMLNADMMTGVKALAETVLILTAANVLEGLASWVSGSASLATFGSQLPGLGTNLSSFATNLGTFDETRVATVTCAANAIKALAQAAEAIPNEGGWAAKILGENSIATFGSYLPALGTNLSLFSTNLGTFDDSKVSTVTCAANAIKALAQAAEAIPNEGGWAAKILGDNSLATFGSYLPALGTNLSSFATNLGTFDDTKVATVTCAANSIKALADAASNIPNEGGIFAAILGDNSLATFGSQLPGLGTNLSSFATNLGTFDDTKLATVECACSAIEAFADAADEIDGQADWAKTLFGDDSLSTFSSQFGVLGTNLKSFVTNLGTFTSAQVNTVKAAVDALEAFGELSEVDFEDFIEYASDFGDELEFFGDNIADFCDSLPSSEVLTAAVAGLKGLLGAIDDITDVDSSALSDIADDLDSIGGEAVSNFINAFSDNTAQTALKTAAQNLAGQVEKGVKAKQATIKTAFKNAAGGGVTGVREKYQSFYDAGAYLVSGFAAGISANSYKASAKAKAMAAAAEQAARNELEINSPSKVFYEIGKWVPEGFAMGIDKLGGLVKRSATNMGDIAINGIGTSISRIASAMSSDIDAQPTIRPVLDLSNVRTGAGAIGDMLGSGYSMGILANANAISATMDRNRQNGADNEVVSAINKLRKDLANVGNTTYSINGITYDDGSNVTEAIKSITRYAMMERRS